mgnify:CR=1 FL=1
MRRQCSQYYGDAEAKGEGGFSANDAINLLRDRADVMMPHWNGTPANWFERYKRERMVEMAFEDQRILGRTSLEVWFGTE